MVRRFWFFAKEKSVKKYLKSFGLAVLLVTGLGALAACIDRSEAGGSSGPTQAAFDALSAKVTTLEQGKAAQDAKIADLETTVAALAKTANVVTFGAVATGKQKAAVLAEGDPLTYLSYLPANKPIYQATSLQLRSGSGFLFALPAPSGGYPLPATVYYAAADCSSPPFVSYTDLSEYGRKQGAVFSYSTGVSTENIGYVPPDAALVSGDFAARGQNGLCEAGLYSFPNPVLTEVLPNDPAVTGVQNTPYEAPVVMQ